MPHGRSGSELNYSLQEDVVGLIPAGGQASRLGALPCSKELYPIGFRKAEKEGVLPKVACHYTLEKMRAAGITQIYIILKPGKWDIPSYFRDGAIADVHLAYLTLGLPFGAPYTLDQAYPFVQKKTVALGFADILFHGEDAYSRLLEMLAQDSSDLILGLFPADRPDKVDMVNLDSKGKITGIVVKPSRTDLHYTWGIAVWKPSFTQFMHEFLRRSVPTAAHQPELFVGDVIHASILEGLHVQGTEISHEPYVDIGTSEDLSRAIRSAAVR
ncbi:MAG: dTDP-glucose pyrophosphorylase [Deltaproteobacteria bacterium]|nr:dTDP-glucose pyrophosphorylase [Deltaproteobacteria bacterium]